MVYFAPVLKGRLMSDILIQFHAMPSEISAWLSHLDESAFVGVTVIRFPPFTAEGIERSGLSSAVKDESVRRLVFTVAKPAGIGRVTGIVALLDANPQALVLDIGRLGPAGLAESCLSGRALVEPALAIWRAVAKQFRGETLAGMEAVNPDTGACTLVKQHRYSPGAAALAGQSNVKLLALGGGLHYRLRVRG
jgi:hypothetical protein